MSDASKPILVYGASGHTGRFVVAELHRRGHAVVLSGRDADRLAEVAGKTGSDVRTAAIDDAAALDRAVQGCAAAINCAGPFLDTAEPVIEACLRAGVAYVDVTAEQACALHSFERFDAPARQAGVPVLPGVGFYGGLGDLLATAAMGDWAEADAVHLAVALDSWHPTKGTRATGQRNTAPKVAIRAGRLQPLEMPPLTRTWDFPAPFGIQDVVEAPLTEAVLIARHLKTAEARTFINSRPLQELRDPSTPGPVAVDETGRSAQMFLMTCRAYRGGAVRQASVVGQDIYAVTAPLAVETVERVLRRSGGGGVFAVGEILDAAALLFALSPDDLVFDISR